MARINYDGVVEAVRYSPDGLIDLVRVYERRGIIFTDRILLSRQAFLERLRSGRKFVIGQRLKYRGGTFETGPAVVVQGPEDQPVLVTEGQQANGRDDLKGVPVF